MAYRIRRKDSSVDKAIRRIAREQFDKALALLDDRDDRDDISNSIHEVRKRCKKLRGLIRLVGPAFPDIASENAALRDAGALLAGARDTQVALTAFDAIVTEANGRLAPEKLAPYREQLSQAVAGFDLGDALDKRLSECRERLLAARERSRGWKLSEQGWDAIGGGLGKTYSRAHKAAARVASEGTDEAFHLLRKQMKYHWYHSRLLQQISPRELTKRARHARDLTEILGQHHDLFVLERRLRDAFPYAEHPMIETLQVLSRRRRAIQEEQVSEMSARLLKHEPKKLVSEWHEQWKLWHR